MSIRQGLSRDLKIHSVATVRSVAFSLAAHAEDNIIVIGGPAMNEMWKVYADRLNAPYKFRRTSNGYGIEAQQGDDFFGEVRRPDGTSQDHALVILARNPFEPSNRLIMMAGCGFLATLAAPVLFSYSFARQLTRQFDTKQPVALVLSVEDVGGYMPKPVIVAHAQFAQV
ncbi:hypothetical protein AR457_10060 [Streptomyces agglomeratus]|nr:hypothetical protein BGK70_26595 [Streptomyces agglomeratus]OEJ44394.1 hypothetical protein AR457_10060 [Streptomyces agglomeratus]